MKRVSVILCLFFNVYVFPLRKCVENNTEKLKKTLPYFRRQVEEVLDEVTTEKSDEDANINLVAFLVRNAKEIFGETEDTTFLLTRTSINPTATYSSIHFRNSTSKTEFNITTMNTSINTTATTSTESKFTISENVTKTLEVSSTTINATTATQNSISTDNLEFAREKLFSFPSDLKFFGKTKRMRTKPRRKQSSFYIEPNIYNVSISQIKLNLTRRSCILCNNVQLKECNDPNQKMIPSVKCNHEEDMCYSQQTPFGLIDRGCFNINLNMTTYVCSCNLCNYISISEMPYIFSKKKDWVDNVIDLTRTNGFRSSIYKDMSCLSCEVNTTAKTFDMLHNTNCLEGNIGVLPTQQCAEDEICGIRALRNDGYVWRGCLKSPLYNYWWSLCDSDLCNHDTVISLYDSNY